MLCAWRVSDTKLVDEYDLWIMPTRVGQGKRAFADVETDKNGVVALTYRPR